MVELRAALAATDEAFAAAFTALPAERTATLLRAKDEVSLALAQAIASLDVISYEVARQADTAKRRAAAEVERQAAAKRAAADAHVAKLLAAKRAEHARLEALSEIDSLLPDAKPRKPKS